MLPKIPNEPLPRPDDERVDQLAGEFIDRYRRGESPTVDEYADRFPHLAAKIRDLFPTVAAMEGLRLHKEQQQSELPQSTDEPPPERLGDFRLLREIGRGGMGVVYEAEQMSLGRRVAVKVFPRRMLHDSRHVKRFKREARMAARLHHTNIVPVFGVGTQEGYHFYVMQLIDGAGLDKYLNTVLRSSIVAELDGGQPGEPLPGEESMPERAQWIARIGQQVAGALQYAHDEGILHRDIKPGNLLLDRGGNVLLTDFGLATAVGSDSWLDSSKVVGTWRYMPPEAFEGEIDSRSDIYSVGISLYELLVRAPAFSGHTRGELVQKIQQGRLPRARQLNPSVPRDLDAILARCTARSADDRYSSAQRLADDLARFLEGRPVSARPISPLERLWRWSRRNAALASLAGGALAALFVTLALLGRSYAQLQASLARERAEKTRVALASQVAADSLDSIFSRFAPDRAGLSLPADPFGGLEVTGGGPVLSREAAELLQQLLRYYDQLAAVPSSDPALIERALAARRRVGDIHRALGEFEHALAAYENARDKYVELQSDRAVDLRNLASLDNDLGQVLLSLNRREESRRAHESAKEMLQRRLAALADDQVTDNQALKFELARTYYLLARRQRPGDSPGLLPAHLAAGPPNGPPPRPTGKGPSPRGRKPPPDGSAHLPLPDRPDQKNLSASIAILQQYVTPAGEGPPAFRQLLALCHRESAGDHWSGRRTEDRESIERSQALLEGLVQEFPHELRYRHDLAEAFASFAVHGDSIPPAELATAEKQLRLAVEHGEELAEQRPDVAEYVFSLVHYHFKLAHVLIRQTQEGSPSDKQDPSEVYREAERSLRRSISLQGMLVKRFPDVHSNLLWLGEFQSTLANLLYEQDRLDESRQFYSRAARSFEKLLVDGEQSPTIELGRRRLADTYISVGQILEELGKPEEASQAYYESRQARLRPVGAPRPAPPAFLKLRAHQLKGTTP